MAQRYIKTVEKHLRRKFVTSHQKDWDEKSAHFLKSRMMVVHLDQLIPYQGVARGEKPQGGSSENARRMNTTSGGRRK
jgi:hypothetical protein